MFLWWNHPGKKGDSTIFIPLNQHGCLYCLCYFSGTMQKRQNPVFIDLLLDFAFKRMFGRETNKDILIDLLNTFIPGKNIVDIIFLNNERTGKTKDSRNAVFDLFCITSSGEYIIIEVQRAAQEYLQTRGLFYVANAITDQSEKGKEFDFNCRETWFFCITDFIFDPDHENVIVHTIKSIELETGNFCHNLLNSIYLELPKFKKQITELETRQDKWLFILKNISSLKEIPLNLKGDQIFEKVFEVARVTNLTKKEMNAHWLAWKDRCDHINMLNYAKKKGKEEGEKRSQLSIAAKMLHKNIKTSIIQELTGLSEKDILALRNRLKIA